MNRLVMPPSLQAGYLTYPGFANSIRLKYLFVSIYPFNDLYVGTLELLGVKPVVFCILGLNLGLTCSSILDSTIQSIILPSWNLGTVFMYLFFGKYLQEQFSYFIIIILSLNLLIKRHLTTNFFTQYINLFIII